VHVLNAGRWGAAAAVLAFASASAGGLHVAGRAGRTFVTAGAPVGPGPEVVLVRTNADAARAWHARGLRGRVVLHAGRFLHFVEESGSLLELSRGPGSGRAWERVLLEAAGPRNHLWVAAAGGVARSVRYLSPPAALRVRLGAIGKAGSTLPLAIPDRAFPRWIDEEAPRLAEPVLVDVNASWFDESGGEELLALLRRAGTTTDLVTLSLAEGNDDVSEAARARLRAFAASLGAREERGIP